MTPKQKSIRIPQKGRAFQSGRKLRVKRGKYSKGYRTRLAVDPRKARRALYRSGYRVNPGKGVRIVYNKLLGGWYIVRGPHQTPFAGRFDSKEHAQAHLREQQMRRDRPRRSREEQYELLRDGAPVTRGTYSQLVAYMHSMHPYSMDHALKYEGFSVRPWLKKNPARPAREIVTLTGTRSGRILGYATPDTARPALLTAAGKIARAHREPVKIERVNVKTRGMPRSFPAPVRAYLANPRARIPSVSEREQVKAAARRFSRFTGQRADKVNMIPYPKNPGAGLAVGPVLALAYTATRDGRTQNYMHKFSPHAAPKLISSHDGRQLILSGGRYKFTERGIVDA